MIGVLIGLVALCAFILVMIWAELLKIGKRP